MTQDLLKLIHSVVQSSGRRTALRCHDGTLTYEALWSAASSIANGLLAVCDHPERVAVTAGDDLHTYCALLGIWMAGAAYVPLGLGNPLQRNVEILSDARISAVIGSAAHEPTVEAARLTQTPWIDAIKAARTAGTSGRAVIASAEQLAYILYTSGTTGRPKGVPIYHRNLNAFRDAWLADPAYSMTADDRFLQMFKLTFDLSVMSIFVPWTLGASVHVVPQTGVAYLNIYNVLREQTITVSMLVPSVLSYLSRFFEEISLPELRYSMFCGEALPHSLAEKWARCVPNAIIQNTYGPTEATIFCYAYDWELNRSARESVNDIVPIGLPIQGMSGVILGDSDTPVRGQEVGELCLLGQQLTDGYWRRPDRTAQSFIDVQLDGQRQRAYRTGDLASQLADGTVIWRGRTDHQIKIDGHRIELGEIEAHARMMSDASAAAAVAVSSDTGHTRIMLFVEGGKTDLVELRERLAGQLPAYMMPADIRRLAELPLNDNGKIDRGLLTKSIG